jgi:hypothetical protein
MEIAHLWVILYTKRIIWISSNSQSIFIYSNNPVSRRSFKHMQFNQTLFRCLHYSKLTQSHLEHHVLLQHYFCSHHQERASSWPNVSHEEPWLVLVWILWTKLELTMTSRNKTFWYHNVIWCRMTTHRSTILSNDVDIVEKLTFNCL